VLRPSATLAVLDKSYFLKSIVNQCDSSYFGKYVDSILEKSKMLLFDLNYLVCLWSEDCRDVQEIEFVARRALRRAERLLHPPSGGSGVAPKATPFFCLKESGNVPIGESGVLIPVAAMTLIL
jgi:hypothetical protein